MRLALIVLAVLLQAFRLLPSRGMTVKEAITVALLACTIASLLVKTIQLGSPQNDNADSAARPGVHGLSGVPKALGPLQGTDHGRGIFTGR